jgi:hypothetical protein
MKNPPPSLHRRLIFRLTVPLLGALILFALAFQIFYLSPIKEFIRRDIRQSMHMTINDIYKICEKNFMESFQSRGLHDEKETRIKKAWTLGIIENLMRREEVSVFVYRNRQVLLAPEEKPELADRLHDREESDFKRDSWYIPLNIGGKEYYMEKIYFAPWHWNIYLLRESRVFANLFEKLYFAYGVSFFILSSGGLLFFYFILNTIFKPIRRILDPLQKGEKPDYKGIYEFNYLSDQFKEVLEKQEEEKKNINQLSNPRPWGS